jgi:hypothetical protein
MLWFIQVIFEIVFQIIALITNPFVILFSNECGQLPKLLKWWQTEDNPLDVRWMIYEDGCTPNWFHYDYDKHYIYHEEDNSKNIAGYVELINDSFTFKEKLQRYLCRLAWVYRNSGYGFSYYVNGRDYIGTDQIVIKSDPNSNWFSYIGNNIITTTWSYFYCKSWCSKFVIRIYLGWKLKGDNTSSEKSRTQLAFSINPFRSK